MDKDKLVNFAADQLPNLPHVQEELRAHAEELKSHEEDHKSHRSLLDRLREAFHQAGEELGEAFSER